MKEPLASANNTFDHSMESRILLEEVRMLYDGMLFSMLATLLVSLIMFLVLYEHVSSPDSLLLWFGIMITSMIIRSWDTWCYNRATPDEHETKPWGLRFLIGSTFAGFWWGMLAWLGHSAENEYQTLIVVCIIGVVGGSLATLSYRWQTIVFFLMPALLLLELHLIYDNSEFSRVIAYLLTVFILFALSASRRAYKNSNQNVRLRIEAAYNEEALRAAKNEAEKANSAKSTFLSNISHELRTPLHAIIGFTQLLEHSEPPSKKQLSYIHEIDNAGEMLLGLVDQILDLASIEKGNLNIIMTSIRLIEVINECKSLVQPLADKKNITIDAAGTRVQAFADYTRLKQVIINLLTNSIKYNHENGTVTINCHSLDNNRVRIDVIDTGRGIAKSQQARLFQPFSRLNPGEETDGTGIGLSISKQLVEMMHGTLGLDSDTGKGCRFSIELDGPVHTSIVIPEEITPPAGRTRITASQARSNVKILVVEDSKPNLRMIQGQLEMLGYPTDTATDGKEALQLFRNNDYGLIITDCNMPNMNGYELTSVIRNEDHSSIPIIALSADAFPEREKQCLAAGMNARLTKPLNLESLQAAIDQWMTTSILEKNQPHQ